MTPDFKQPAHFLLWALGLLVAGAVVRIGWEIGGKLWGIF